MQAQGVFGRLSHLVNRNELVFDVTISLTAIVVYRLIVPESGFIFSNQNLGVMIAVIICVQFFTALFFASILKKQDELKQAATAGAYPAAGTRPGIVDRINKRLLIAPFIEILLCVFVFIGITGLYILMPMKLYNVIDAITINASGDDANQFLGMFTFFLCSSAVILAGVALFKGQKASMRWFFIICIPFAYLALAWPLSIVYFAYLAGAFGAILFVLVSGGSAVGIVLLKRYFSDRDISTVPVLNKVAGPFRVLVIPFCTALALIVWSEMSLVSAAHELAKEGLAINLANLFWLLLLGGLVPVRAMVLFAPPVKPVNIIISIGAFYLFFSSLDSVLAKLA